jgi:hypothetical protein
MAAAMLRVRSVIESIVDVVVEMMEQANLFLGVDYEVGDIRGTETYETRRTRTSVRLCV